MFEVQSTPRALSALPLEQYRPLRRRFRMSAHSACPVDPVAIIRATRARDFRISTNRGRAMFQQLDLVRRFERPLTLAGVPVFLADPPRRFVRMTAACPSTQVRVKRRIHAHESLFGDHRCIVVTPSSNDRVKALDQHFLRRGCAGVSLPHASGGCVYAGRLSRA